VGAELRLQTLPAATLAPDLLVHAPMSGINHHGGFRKRLGPMLDQTV
jgi:hypothetical protein